MKKRMILVALLMVSTVVQPAYKCREGERSYYSNSPDCVGEVDTASEPAPAASKNSASQSPLELGRMLCAGRPSDPARWEAWEGMNTEHIGGGEMVMIKYAGRNMSARRYFRRSPAKRRFGGSTDSLGGGCYTSIDGRRLLNSANVSKVK